MAQVVKAHVGQPGLLYDALEPVGNRFAGTKFDISFARPLASLWKRAFGTRPSPLQSEELVAWRKDWQLELLEEAINAASEAGAENRIGYIRSTLLDWKMRGIRTITQWADEEARRDGLIR